MPKQIPLSVKREWLKEHDEGKTAAEIAKGRKHALKVIKRGIDEARAERDGAAARAEIVKEALIKHQQQLLGIVERLLEATEIPPADLELRWERNGSLAPIILAFSRIVYTPSQGLIVELSDQNTTLWGLFREHLARDRIWSSIRNWREALISHIRERIELVSEIRTLIETETGFKVTEGKHVDEKSSFVYAHAVNLFYTVHMRKALGVLDGTNPQDRMVATDDGYVRHGLGGSEMAYCPGKQEECREALIRVFAKIPDLPVVARVVTTEGELKKVSDKLRRRLEDIQLMGLVSGRCRICSRISL